MGSFRKATKSQAKLRAALFGPSGSGKTFTALRVATGLGGNIALIDSERGSASKYADRFSFDVAELGGKTIDDYCRFIKDAAGAGYSILIIDSLSHAWQELLEEIDRLASTKFRGNTWSAWSEGTPKQKRLVEAILSYPGHVIATMRSKTEWKTSDGGGGKSRPERVGLAPEQGKGIEYEFDLLIEISPDHFGTITKDRTGRYQDKILDRPGEDFGRELAAWLSDGEPQAGVVSPRTEEASPAVATPIVATPAGPPWQSPAPKPAQAESMTKVVKRFEGRLSEFCQKINAAWIDRKTGPDGTRPGWVKDDLVTSTQLVDAMLKQAGIELPSATYNARMKAAAELWLADEKSTLELWRSLVTNLKEDLEAQHANEEDAESDAESDAEPVEVGVGREPGSDDE